MPTMDRTDAGCGSSDRRRAYAVQHAGQGWVSSGGMGHATPDQQQQQQWQQQVPVDATVVAVPISAPWVDGVGHEHAQHGGGDDEDGKASVPFDLLDPERVKVRCRRCLHGDQRCCAKGELLLTASVDGG